MELALKYMEIFFSEENIEKLSQLFAEDFTFRGPLYEFDSAEDYINSLKSNPPHGFADEIIGSFENMLLCLSHLSIYQAWRIHLDGTTL